MTRDPIGYDPFQMEQTDRATRIENIGQIQDCERLFRQLSTQGNKLIFGTTFSQYASLKNIDTKAVRGELDAGADYNRNRDAMIGDGTLFIRGDEAEVIVVVGWQASWWEPPTAKSKRTSMDATQHWIVRGLTLGTVKG